MVRVWMRPSELGEQGYSIDFPEATGYTRLKGGALILTADERGDDTQVGRVEPERWDAVVVLEDAP